MALLNLRLVIAAVDRATAPVKRITAAVRVLGQQNKWIGGLALNISKAAGALVGLAGVSWVGLATGAVRTSAKFEQFETVLTTVEGSAQKARASMDWVTKFAAKTPYELDQVMSAFVQLRAYGIDPTGGSLRSLGDGASAMNKDLMQAVEALADAQTGEFERLKEFAIRASAKGSQVTFAYERAGKQMKVTAEKNSAAIRKAILGIFDDRFAGAMDKQSKTFNGMLSNLKDSWTQFQLAIGQAGVFDWVKTELGALLKKVNVAVQDGSLQRWAKDISGALTEMLRTIRDVLGKINWVEFIRGVTGTIKAVSGIVQALGGFKGVVNAVFVAMIFKFGLSLIPATAALWGFNGALYAFPGTWIIAAIVGLAAAAFLIYRNWDKIGAFFGRLWGSVKKATGSAIAWLVKAFLNFTPYGLVIKNWDKIVAFFGSLWERVKTATQAGLAALGNWIKGLNPATFVPPWVQALLNIGSIGARAITNAGRMGSPRGGSLAPTARGANAAQRVNVGGELQIGFDQRGQPQVRSIFSNNRDFDLSVSRGWVGGF